MSKGTKSFGHDKALACESRGFVCKKRGCVVLTHPQVSLEMKEQQSEDVAASVSEENKDAKDMKQSASSNDNEQTEVEEEKVARSAFHR